MQDLKTRAESALALAEEANRKANSESGYAFNAKQVAEEHAKAIAQVRGAVDADSNWLSTTKQNALDAESAIAAAKKAAESLLPGATSAGLASAFRDQKARFDRPQTGWLVLFVVTIIALVVLGSLGFDRLISEEPSWDAIWRHIVTRLPVAGPLVWLALLAVRNYSLAQRLQEEYAYKEAIATAFEGFRREMSSVTAPTEQAHRF